MSSEVEICNRALQKLGAQRITSLTDGSKNARACLTAYYPLRDAEQRKHRWSFCVQRFSLAASNTAPLFGKTNFYPLPSGWLRLLEPDPKWNLNDRDWVIEGDSICTDDAAPLQVRLIMKIEDPNVMDPLFREALAAKIAEEICEELTQSNEKKSVAKQDYKEAIAEAKKINGIEDPPQEAPLDTYITSRF